MQFETVFKGPVTPLSKEQGQILMMALMAEETGSPLDPAMKKDRNWSLCAIIEKRIEVLKLPIKFTDYALIAHLAFSDRPGKSVMLLIDSLTKYEGQTVTSRMLCDLYPMGFYSDDTATDYIDNHLKKRTVKWSEIY